jgi:hypothetical protein
MERTEPLIIVSDATLEELKIERKPMKQAVKELQKMINGFKSAAKGAKGQLKSIYKDEIDRLERAMTSLQTESAEDGTTVIYTVEGVGDVEIPDWKKDLPYKVIFGHKSHGKKLSVAQYKDVDDAKKFRDDMNSKAGWKAIISHKGKPIEEGVQIDEAKAKKVRVVDPHVVEVGIDKQGNWYWKGKNGLVNSYTGKSSKEKMRQEARQVGNGKFIDKAIKELEGMLEGIEEDTIEEAIPKSTGYVLFNSKTKKIVAVGSKSAMVKARKKDQEKASDAGSDSLLKVGMTVNGKVGGHFGKQAIKETIVVNKLPSRKNKHPDYKGEVKVRDIKVGKTFKVNKKKDKDDGAEVYITAVKPKDQTVIVKFGGRTGTRRGQYSWDDLVNEDAVASIGNGTIPTGPESVGVKVKPDFNFKGLAGFDCSANTFGKCLQGKKKYKRWNTYLDRNDELVGKVKNYMGQSYKNTNFVLRNSGTGEMVVARRT